MKKHFGKKIKYDGKIIYINREIKEVDGVIYVYCKYSNKFLPITDFRIRKHKEVYYLDRSKTGEREQSYKDGAKPKEIKNKIINGIMHRKCVILKKFLPISEFWKYRKKNGKEYYSSVSREGKKIENVKHKQSTLQAIKVWKKNNNHMVNAQTAKRRALKANATPKWFNEKHKQDIQKIFKQREAIEKETGIKQHVHHIYPLFGCDNLGNHISCGLHVPWNLIVVPASLNLKINDKNPEYHSFI